MNIPVNLHSKSLNQRERALKAGGTSHNKFIILRKMTFFCNYYYWQSIIIQSSEQQRIEIEKMWESIQTRILTGSYRISEWAFNSSTLILLKILVNNICVVLILPTSQGASLQQSNVFSSAHTWIRSFAYFYFCLNPNNILEYYIILSIFFIMLLVYIAGLMRQQISNLCKNITKVIWYFVNVFKYIMIAISLSMIDAQNGLQGLAPKMICLLYLPLLVVFCSLGEYLQFSGMYKKISKQSKTYDEYFPFIKFILTIILVYAVVRKNNIGNVQLIVLQVIMLLIWIFWVFRILTIKLHWYNSYIQIVDYVCAIGLCCYYLISIIEKIVPLVHDNRWLVFTSLYIWTCLAYYNYVQYSKVSLLISTPHQIKSQKQAITYIRLLYSIFQKRLQPSNSILLLGLVKNHINECVNVKCICKMKLKKNSVDVQTNLIKDVDFFLDFIHMSIQMLREKFEGYDISLAYLTFQIEIMHRFPKYFYESDIFRRQNQRKRMSLAQKYTLFQIYNISVEQVLKKRTDQELYSEKSKQLMLLEQKIQTCYQLLQKISYSFSMLYKYNSRTFCDLNLIRNQLEDIYTSMMELRKIFNYGEKLEDCFSQELVYLMFFFYHNIFCLNFKAKPILASLEQLYKRLQLKQLSQNNFDISLYSESGCVIQSTLQSNVFGLISKISENAPTVFGYPSHESMLSLDINRLLPRCSREEHQKMIRDWLSTGSFKKINKLQETFCLDYRENLFKVLMKSQIAIIEGKIAIFVGLIKLDSDDYMIVDKQGKIDSYGIDFGRLLIKQSKTKPITEAFPNWHSLINNISREPKSVKTKLHIKRRNIKSKRSGILIHEQKNPQEQIEQAIVLVLQLHVGSMRNQEYTVVKKMGDEKVDMNLIISSRESQDVVSLSQLYSVSNPNFNQKYKSYNFVKQQQHQLVQISSVSSGNNDLHFTVWRMLEEIKNKATQGENLQNNMLFYAKIVLLCLFVLLLILMGCLLMVLINGSESFNQVIFADLAVSDNMQLLEMIYNNIVVFGQFCNSQNASQYNPSQCQWLKSTASDQTALLQQLLSLHIEYLMKNITFFGNYYYSYQFTQATLNLNSTSMQVGTFQFMQFYIRSSKYVIQSLNTNNTLGQQYQLTIKLLKDNWSELKRLNHFNIKYYQDMGIDQLKLYTFYIVLFGVFYGIFVTCYTAIQYFVETNMFRFVNRVLSLFRRVPVPVSEQLSEYYKATNAQIKTKDILLLAKIKMPDSNQGHSFALLGYNESKDYKYLIYLIMFWTVTIVMLVFSNYMMVEYSNLQKNTIITLNKLLQSQNYMLENYFELTALYMHGNPTESDLLAYEANLFNTLGVNENNFVKTALEINDLAASEYDQLADQFSELLIRDICEVAKNVTTQQQKFICNSTMDYDFLRQGVLTVMTFFQNIIIDSAMKLRLVSMSQGTNRYFTRKQFRDLNKYTLFLLRVYQATQQRMVFILSYIKQQKLRSVNMIIALQLILQTFSIIKWIVEMKRRRQQYAKCYGFILAFPIHVIKESKFIQQELASLL